MKSIASIGVLCAIAGCSPTHTDANLSERYQFVSGSKERVSVLFDRVTGCISEIKWAPDWARNPQFDPSKPFTTEDAPVEPTAKDSGQSGDAKLLQAKPDPKTSDNVAAVSSFEPWQCPKPAPALVEVIKK
jgi:hypothetical protein